MWACCLPVLYLTTHLGFHVTGWPLLLTVQVRWSSVGVLFTCATPDHTPGFSCDRLAPPAGGAGAVGERRGRAPPVLPGAAAAGSGLALPALAARRRRRLHLARAHAQPQEGKGEEGSQRSCTGIALNCVFFEKN